MLDGITATFENGVFKPTEPLDLPDHSEVRLTVEVVNDHEQRRKQQEALQALEDLWKKSNIHSKEERLTRDQLHERR